MTPVYCREIKRQGISISWQAVSLQSGPQDKHLERQQLAFRELKTMILKKMIKHLPRMESKTEHLRN